MIRDERAKQFADQTSGWYEAKIREAYRAGWNDAERNMMEKAEALRCRENRKEPGPAAKGKRHPKGAGW